LEEYLRYLCYPFRKSVRVMYVYMYVFIVFFSATYRSRNRRQLSFATEGAEAFDAVEVEKYIVGEFGARACIFERVCAHYAARARTHPRPQMDWPDVFRYLLNLIL
jgi:hypothetical protein